MKVAPLLELDVTEAGEIDPHWLPGPGALPHGTPVPSSSKFAVSPIESLVGFPFPSNEVAVIVWVVLISMVVVAGVTTRVSAFGFLIEGSQAETNTTSASVSINEIGLRFIA